MFFFGQLLRRVHVRIAELLRCRSFPPVLSPFRVNGDTGLPSTIKMPKHTALPSCGCVHPRCQTRAVWLWLTGSAVHTALAPPLRCHLGALPWCLAPSGTTNNAPACLLTQRRDSRGASGPAAAVAGHAVRAWRGGQATRAVTVGGLQTRKTRRVISVRRARSSQLTGKVGSTPGGLTNLNRLNG